jgi:hypothetical protein
MNSFSLTNQPFSVGRFLISPLAKTNASGAFEAAVSIRSGQGASSHDRVVRFTPLFHCRESALHYAAVQGCEWLQNQGSSHSLSHSIQ